MVKYAANSVVLLSSRNQSTGRHWGDLEPLEPQLHFSLFQVYKAIDKTGIYFTFFSCTMFVQEMCA